MARHHYFPCSLLKQFGRAKTGRSTKIAWYSKKTGEEHSRAASGVAINPRLSHTDFLHHPVEEKIPATTHTLLDLVYHQEKPLEPNILGKLHRTFAEIEVSLRWRSPVQGRDHSLSPPPQVLVARDYTACTNMSELTDSIRAASVYKEHTPHLQQLLRVKWKIKMEEMHLRSILDSNKPVGIIRRRIPIWQRSGIPKPHKGPIQYSEHPDHDEVMELWNEEINSLLNTTQVFIASCPTELSFLSSDCTPYKHEVSWKGEIRSASFVPYGTHLVLVRVVEDPQPDILELSRLSVEDTHELNRAHYHQAAYDLFGRLEDKPWINRYQELSENRPINPALVYTHKDCPVMVR